MPIFICTAEIASSDERKIGAKNEEEAENIYLSQLGQDYPDATDIFIVDVYENTKESN